MSRMDNKAYRKSRGTDKPFSGSQEQTKAIWGEYVRKGNYQYKKPDSTPGTPPKS
jgi:hypothetical protein